MDQCWVGGGCGCTHPAPHPTTGGHLNRANDLVDDLLDDLDRSTEGTTHKVRRREESRKVLMTFLCQTFPRLCTDKGTSHGSPHSCASSAGSCSSDTSSVDPPPASGSPPPGLAFTVHRRVLAEFPLSDAGLSPAAACTA